MSVGKLDIYNLALAHVGSASLIASEAENSVERKICDRHYDIARRSLLNLSPWNFATKYLTLTETALDQAEYQYAYVYPSDCINIYKIIPSSDSGVYYPRNTMNAKWQVVSNASSGGKIVLTDIEQAVAVFKADITNTRQFSPLFVDTLAYLLASRISMPLTQSASITNQMDQKYQASLLQANTANLSEAGQDELPESELITVRN